MESDPREAEVQFFRVTEDILGTLPMTSLVSAGIKSYHDTHEDPVRSVREKTIAHALQMHNQGIKRCHIFGVAGIRCLQTALEETLKAHGFDVSLETMFGNLLDTKNYAVSVIINFWFLRSVEMVNAALEEGGDVLRFGSNRDSRITFAAAKKIDELMVKDEDKTVFDFLSNVEDNGELLTKARSESVRKDARERIVRFSHHVGWMLNRAFGNDAKHVFQQVCVCFMSAVAMLVMKHYEQEMKKLASPQ
jgi:hypothetical protein